MICHLLAGKPRKPESKCPRTRSVNVQGQKIDAQAQAKSKFALPLPFCYIKALDGLG